MCVDVWVRMQIRGALMSGCACESDVQLRLDTYTNNVCLWGSGRVSKLGVQYTVVWMHFQTRCALVFRCVGVWVRM